MDDFLSSLPFLNGGGIGANNSAATFVQAFAPMIALIAGFFAVLAVADFVLNLMNRERRPGSDSARGAAALVSSGAGSPRGLKGMWAARKTGQKLATYSAQEAIARRSKWRDGNIEGKISDAGLPRVAKDTPSQRASRKWVVSGNTMAVKRKRG